MACKDHLLEEKCKETIPSVIRGSLGKMFYIINYEIFIRFLIFANLEHEK